MPTLCQSCGSLVLPTGCGCLRSPILTNTAGAAHKADAGKLPMELLSPIALEGTAAVLRFGAKKYAPNNWRKGLSWTRVLGAILRHTFELMAGRDLDDETGLPIVDHIACEVMFLQEFYRTRKDLDDRYKIANPGETKKESA